MTDSSTDLGRDLVATAALTLYSLAVAIGFARVFSGWEFLPDLVVLVVVGHGASFALRRAGVRAWIAIPALTVLLLWMLLVLHYRDTMSWLLPTGETWDRVNLEIDVVRDAFQTAVAPVIYGAGWAPLAGFALVVAIVMADSFAFRAEARGEALVPGGVLFVFIAALASPRLRLVSTVLLIATGIVAVIALRALHDRSRRVELTSRQRPVGMLVPTALATALVVALLAGVIGPRIPGAQAEPLYDTRGRGNGVTEVISPLVDIRSRLTNRSEVELFRVSSEAPSYWRVTALPEFDGRRFRLPESPLTDLDDVEVVGDRVVQQIQVLALGSQLVPAAPTPIQAEGRRGPERFSLQGDASSSSLLAPTEFETGDEFTVVSLVPSFSREELQGATSVAPPDEIFLDLPDDLPSLVTDRAAEVTAGIDGSYEQARALQDWFRSEFEYSLEVQSGHGTSAIENFLQQQVGYCEQFSATFAAMGRTLGIPTRVAVGFTPGVQGSDGWYRVLGKNAHAWPEVWFDGIGWVPFEPTPGRGAPGAESYTDVEPQQDETPSGATVDPNVTNPPTPTTIVPSQSSVPGSTPGPTTTVLDDAVPNLDGNEADGTRSAPAGEGAEAEEGFAVPWTTIVVLGVLFLALLTPWAVRRWRLRAARRDGPVQRVQAAWRHALDAVIDAGVTGRASMTTHEWATATAASLPVAARPMSSLAEVVDQISFAPPGRVDLQRQGALGDTLGRDCELWSEQVSHIARDTLSNPQRIKRYFTDWS